jgi:hypothetical protein
MHQNVQSDPTCNSATETTATDVAPAAVEPHAEAEAIDVESAEDEATAAEDFDADGDERSIWYQLSRTQEHIAALRKACLRPGPGDHAAEQVVAQLDAMNDACEELTDAYKHFEAELFCGETDADLCMQVAFHLGEIDRQLALFVPVARLQALMPKFCLAFDKRTTPTEH